MHISAPCRQADDLQVILALRNTENKSQLAAIHYLGDGCRLTLPEIRRGDYRFDRLDLLVFSACATAIDGGKGVDGNDVKGLALLAQRKGAKSVLANHAHNAQSLSCDPALPYRPNQRGPRHILRVQFLLQIRITKDTMPSVSKKYLFIDDQWIAGTHAIHRSCGRPRKYEGNPIIKADKPWEGGVKLYGTVLRENGLYRMWYQMLNFKEKEEQHFVTGVGYAESDDGLAWTKPLKGARHPRHGKTNVLVPSSGRTHLCSPSVVRNDDALDPRDRYRMMFYDAMLGEDLEKLGCPFPTSPTIPGWRGIEGEGMFVCRSKDGIRWERPALPSFSGPNDVASMSRLPDGRLLAAYKTSVREDRHFRIIETAESGDGRTWESHGPVLQPDWHDAYGTEFYGMSPFDYFGNLIGLICVYHNSPDDKTLDIQIATSIDGRTWQRAADRGVFLPKGAPGEWDAAGVYVASAPLLKPGDLTSPMRLYYSGINARHDDMRYKEWSIGLATLRQDGFASLDAGYFVGELQTQPVVATSSAIRLNLQCIHGWAELHVLDAESGKELAVSETIEQLDDPSCPVVWKKASPFAGRTVKLFIRMQKAQLYSFWFEPGKRNSGKGK